MTDSGSVRSSLPCGDEGAPLSPGVRLKSGDIFESGAQTIVVTVNCVGIMGKGLALEAKNRYPDVFKQYSELCSLKKVRLGRPVYINRLLAPSILLFPTKDHWRSVSKLSDIEEGLEYLAGHYRDWNITSLAVPPLGCGLGGLEWAVVGPSLYRGLCRLDIPIYLYVPNGIPATMEQLGQLKTPLATKGDLIHACRTSPPEVVAIALALEHALSEKPTKEIGRILMQKLGYFAVQAGIKLQANFERKSFGPYSKEWMSQIRHMVNNGILVEQRLSRAFHDAFAYKPGPSLKLYAEQIQNLLSNYTDAIERLGKLIKKLNSDQAEFAATIHMVASELQLRKGSDVRDEDIVFGVQEWKRRRGKPFEDARIRTCLAWLRSEKWLPNPKPTTETSS